MAFGLEEGKYGIQAGWRLGEGWVVPLWLKPGYGTHEEKYGQVMKQLVNFCNIGKKNIIQLSFGGWWLLF